MQTLGSIFKIREAFLIRIGLSLPLALAISFSLAALACDRSAVSQSNPIPRYIVSAEATPIPIPTPDIRATVVAEITATAIAGYTERPTPTPTAITTLRVPPGSFISPVPLTRTNTPTPTPAPTAIVTLRVPPGSFISPVPLTRTNTPTPTPAPNSVPAPTATPTLSAVVERISPSVVQIVTPAGTGSGFVVHADGLVVTNAHVVERFATVEVRLPDGGAYTGKVLGVDEIADLAVVDIGPRSSLEPATLGDSDEVKVGEDVIAMGFPLGDTLGVSPTITRGIVSAKRFSESEITLLQTDAAINPGNSGGPLFGRNGQVVGVNTSKLFGSDEGKPLEGIGLAVSVNDVRDRLNSLARGESILLNTSSPFGTNELTSAMDSFLPTSFEKIDPGSEGLDIRDIRDIGLEDIFTDFVAYASADLFQIIFLMTGELSDLERIAIEYELSDIDTFMSNILDGSLMGMGSEEDSISDSGTLNVGQIGDGQAGVWIDFVIDEYELRSEVVMFLRDNLLGLVYVFYLSNTDPSVSVEDISRVVDEAMVERAD